MTVASERLRAVEERLGSVRAAVPVAGGCIGAAYRLDLARGGAAFLKFTEHPGLVLTEAAGLRMLRGAAPDTLIVPEVLGLSDASAERGWIALEWIEEGHEVEEVQRTLGRDLAELHRTRGADAWGLPEDNWIGSLPQENTSSLTWADFWWQRRLEPQLDLARARGFDPGGTAEWEALRDRLPALLAVAEEEGPRLLHGDLWSGNVLSSADGRPALIDPAAYYGHREVDLAMAALFGGFSEAFWLSYGEAWPLPAGVEGRRATYQLYYLLVHLNLFGAGYLARTEAMLRRAISAR